MEGEGNSLCHRGERKNGAAPHEVHPGLPAHLGTMGNGRRASDARLKCIPLVKPFCAARPDTPTALVGAAEAGWKKTGFSRGSDPLRGSAHAPASSFSEANEMQAQGQPTTGQLAGSRCRVPKSLADLRRRGGRDVDDHRVLYHRALAGSDQGPAGFRLRRFRRKLAGLRKLPI